MPTYDYKCKACGHTLEIFQSMTESPKRKCPHCGKNALERLIGPGAAILFKGSGFYQTDYRSDSYKKAAKAEKSSSDSSGGAKGESGGSKSDSGSSGSSSSSSSSSTPASSPSSSGSKSSSNGTA